MTDLTRRTLLDPLALDGRDYFASLLAEGQRCGLLSDRDLSRLQGESLTLLAERADAWSHGLSTSLPAERAQQLLGSVLYIVSLELKTGPTPEEAVERLRREPLAALYAAGQKRITRKLQAARTLHRQLKKTLFPTPNQFYRATLADGIDGFFQLYRPALAAQEIHITADYPTFFGLPPASSDPNSLIHFISPRLSAWPLIPGSVLISAQISISSPNSRTFVAPSRIDLPSVPTA